LIGPYGSVEVSRPLHSEFHVYGWGIGNSKLTNSVVRFQVGALMLKAQIGGHGRSWLILTICTLTNCMVFAVAHMNFVYHTGSFGDRYNTSFWGTKYGPSGTRCLILIMTQALLQSSPWQWGNRECHTPQRERERESLFLLVFLPLWCVTYSSWHNIFVWPPVNFFTNTATPEQLFNMHKPSRSKCIPTLLYYLLPTPNMRSQRRLTL